MDQVENQGVKKEQRSVSIAGGDLGARPKVQQQQPEVKPRSKISPPLLKQSSWGSREMSPSTTLDTSVQSGPAFTIGAIKNPEEPSPKVKGGFRNNRDFWEQRVNMRQVKQTPDLVLDLPERKVSPGAAGVLPIPKPRTVPSTPEEETKDIKIISKSNESTPKATSAGRPQVRVKPQVQIRKNEEKNEKKDSKK